MTHNKWFRSLFRQRVLVALLILLQLGFLVHVLVSGSQVSQIFGRIMTLVSVLVALSIIRKREKSGYKLTWVFLILLFPLFGGAFYLIFSFQTSNKRLGKHAHTSPEPHTDLFYLPEDAYARAERELPQHVPQIRYLQQFAGFPIYTGTRTRYFSPGEEFLSALLQELEKAEKYIFLEFFIIQEGEMWNSILEILKRKAAQGVKVRLIYDDMGCILRLPKDYPKTLEDWGIECCVFNPFRPVLTSIQNNRDHRKIAVIDGKVAFTGGVNLADEYINAVARFGHWKDCAVMLEGKAAWSFTLIFLKMWALCRKIDEDFNQYYPWRDEPCPVSDEGFVQPYADSPMDAENVGEHVYLQIINGAKDYVYINTPYLVIDDSMVSALCLAAKSGVDVRIVTPKSGISAWCT
ncbi:MAG: phospholipase D-like domain-containing protein [Planctomycetia bacterium]|nr:phospholipase D-like domain-containing protein [Planctomycetia bacterium]